MNSIFTSINFAKKTKAIANAIAFLIFFEFKIEKYLNLNIKLIFNTTDIAR